MRISFYIASQGDIFDSAVDLFTGLYGYSHCELFFSDGTSFSSSPRDGGCRFKVINYNPSKWVMVDLPFSIDREKQIQQECQNYVGKKYDWLGIFLNFLIPIGVQDGSRWWCSEICGKMVGVSKYRISPNKLAKRFNVPRQGITVPRVEVVWNI